MKVLQKSSAIAAIKQNRDDLAREALKRKLTFKKQAGDLQAQLQQLANMTETLIRNSQQLMYQCRGSAKASQDL
jgi:phage shock protein A